MGRTHRRPSRFDSARRCQSGRAVPLGETVRLGGISRIRSQDTQQHQRVPEDHRSLVHRFGQGCAGSSRLEDREPFGKGKCRARYRRLPRGAAGFAHLVRRHRGNIRYRSAHALARLGLRTSETIRAPHPFPSPQGGGVVLIHLPLVGRSSRTAARVGGRSTWRKFMPKVLISDKLSPAAVAIFKERGIETDVKTGLSKYELIKIVGEYDGLAIRSATKVTADVIRAAKNMKVIGRAGIGVDNVDIP